MDVNKLILASSGNIKLDTHQLSVEAKEYEKGKLKQSSNVFVEGEVSYEELSLDVVLYFIRLYLKDQISSIELEYIANVFDLCEIEKESKVEDLVFKLSSPELYGEISQEILTALLEQLEK